MIRLARRGLPLALAGSLMLLTVPAARADDLSDYLATAADANYAGQQATWCSFSGQTQFGVVSVEHAGGQLVVESAGASEMVGGGRYASLGEAGDGVALSDWSTSAPTGRYETKDAVVEQRLGRTVTVFTIAEGDTTRARIWFDEETGAVLGSEVYDGSGDLYRLSWMLDFEDNPRNIYTIMRNTDSTYDVVLTAAPSDLASTVAGYARVDTYRGPDNSVHSFYTDGLFSFSVFVVDGRATGAPFTDAETMNVGGSDYRWVLTPSDLWVNWQSGSRSFVLVGDLPPDHLQEVLAELPQPDHSNLVVRLWRRLFG
jgi:hypothetical protein